MKSHRVYQVCFAMFNTLLSTLSRQFSLVFHSFILICPTAGDVVVFKVIIPLTPTVKMGLLQEIRPAYYEPRREKNLSFGVSDYFRHKPGSTATEDA